MSKLSLRHLYKVYPNGVKAVNDFNMEIEDKEFIVFVGPSGCGKSTTLRMIAGLEEITAGELYIGDQFANHMEPKDRDIAMVFQNYALYPHMTVYENLAFGLNLRHVPQAEIHKKVLWAAKILKLEEYLERKPKALSGGQRQRVSLGRAILRTPKVFLLDEPLSNLDAKLRTEMRAEIAKLHNEIGTTFIYVTHDQVEAMTMGTRIVVMSMGYVQQIDTPQNLYNYPQNKFVAGFIGTPQMNFFDATLLRKGDVVEIRFDGLDNVLTIPFDQMLKVRPEYLTGDKKIIIGLRCENISADAKIVAESKNIMQVKISHFEELGNETLIYGDFNLDVHGLGDSKTSVIVKNYGGEHSCRIGDVINVAVDMSKAHFFDGTTEETIAPRVPTENVFDVAIDGANISLLDAQIALPSAVSAQLEGHSVANGYTLIPTNAFYEGGSDLTAKVVAVEKINGQQVVHLVNGARTFFMIGTREYEIGETLSLEIDFKQISLMDTDLNVIAKPLPEFDALYGAYCDRSNAVRSTNHLCAYYKACAEKEIAQVKLQLRAEQEQVVMADSILKGIKQAHKEKVIAIQEHMSYRLGTEDLGKEGKKKVKKEAEKALAEENQRYLAEVAEFKAKKAEYNALSDDEKAKRKVLEQEILDKYNAIIEGIKAKYDRFIELAKNGIKQMQEDLLPVEKQKATQAGEILKSVEAQFAQAKADELARLEQNIKDAQQRVKDSTGEDRDNAIVLLREAKRAKIDVIAQMQAEHNAHVDDILFESKVFTAYINGLSLVTSLDINKKIVKGLGAQLFLSHYRFEVPHDAYAFDQSGIAVVVEEVLDYGREQFARCSLNGDVLYVKVDSCNVGETLHVVPDIERARIYENKFDIRLC